MNTITEILELSGLTTQQVGRVLGVSGRAVANWAAGDAIPDRQQGFAQRLLDVIRRLPGTTADDRRAALLYSGSGESLFHMLLAQRDDEAVIQHQPLSVVDRLGLTDSGDA